MTHWIFSFITGSLVFALVHFILKAISPDNNYYVLEAILVIFIWLCLGFGIIHIERQDVSDDSKHLSPSTEPELKNANTVAELSTDLQDLGMEMGGGNAAALHGVVLELIKQLKRREKELDVLQAKVTEREFRRSVSRLASINETLGFTLKLLNGNKLSPTDAVEQLRAEIESAISDLGLDIFPIMPGVAVSSLPFGSFVIIGITDNAPHGLAGTVKEVISQGLCVRDEKEKLHFISPSKINIYKL